MTYRDDHDAAIARAEALEREAAQLREKAERLAEENERLASERARLIEQVEGPRRALARRAGIEDEAIVARQPPGRLVSSALHAHTGPAIAAATLPLIGLSVLLAITGVSFVLLLLTIICGAGAGLLVLARAMEADERRERRLLAALPLPLDVAGYLALLDQVHPSPTSVTVEVVFEREPDRAAQHVIAGAIAMAAPSSAIRIEGAQLSIFSAALDTRANKHPDNVQIHRWFRRLAAQGLLPIAAAHPMKRVSVRSSGG